MTWTDLHAIVEMRDDYQLLVACYDTRRPLREAADQLARAMVELGQEKRRIAESALGRDTTTGKKLTMADVERLLETPATDPWQDL